MSTISKDAPIITQINVFTVAPEHQEQLVGLINDALQTVVCRLPGFISANVHASRDGARVCNYAQWASLEAFQAMMRLPEMQASMKACLAIAEPSSAIYDVRAVVSAAA